MTRRLVLVTGAVTIALIAAFWFAAWSPATHQLKSVHAQLSAVRQDQTQLRSQVVTLNGEQRKIASLRAQLAALEAAVPPSPSLDTAVDQLSAAAAASGGALPSVTPSAPTAAAPAGKPGGPQSISVGLSVQGSYAQTVAFVNRLEASPRLFVVDGMTVSPAGARGAVTTTVNTRMFYAAPASPAPAGAVRSAK